MPGFIVRTYCCELSACATGRASGGIGRSRWKGSNGPDADARVNADVFLPLERATLVEVERADEGDAAEPARERSAARDAVTFPVHHVRPLPLRLIVRVAVVWPIGPASCSVAVAGTDPR